MDFMELLQRRYAVRDFTDQAVEEEKLRRILQAAQAAPTGRNAQPWKILVLRSEEALEKAKKCTPCTYNARTILLVCYDSRHPESSLEENDVNVGLTDACIAATDAMMEATELGLGSCWVCLFYGAATKEAFDLPAGWEPACFLPIGYPAAEPGPRHYVRKPLEELVEYR